jgi:BirA family biotin operon repressor/biotin-[acetyl-CoA-carboxylase] ligase
MKNYQYKNYHIHHFQNLESSNKTAFEMAEQNQLSDREIILTDSQSSGKGRNNRKWHSPEGNLYFSMVLRPKISLTQIHHLSFLSVVALRRVVKKILPDIAIQNKWPNDLLIDEKKAAGILLESKIDEKNCHFVVIGVGLNLSSYPNETIFTATSLKEFGAEIATQNILQLFLDEFEDLYQNYLSFGFKKIRNYWLAGAYKLGKNIIVKNSQQQEIEAIFLDLDQEGNLILKNEEKDRIEIIYSADIL